MSTFKKILFEARFLAYGILIGTSYSLIETMAITSLGLIIAPLQSLIGMLVFFLIVAPIVFKLDKKYEDKLALKKGEK